MPDEITTTRERGNAIEARGGVDFQSLMAQAIEKGADMATMERLESMYERAMAREAESAFNNALSELHSRMGSVVKNQQASFKTKSGASVSYRYADKHAIAQAARDAGAGELGLSWKWSYEDASSGVTVTCVLKHRLGHSDTSTWTAPVEAGNPMTSACQKKKIATTFAERVTLASVLGITDCEDDVDGAMPAREQESYEPPPTITPEQAADLRKGLEILGDGAEARFVKAAGIERLEDLPAGRFTSARASINRRVSKQEQE